MVPSASWSHFSYIELLLRCAGSVHDLPRTVDLRRPEPPPATPSAFIGQSGKSRANSLSLACCCCRSSDALGFPPPRVDCEPLRSDADDPVDAMVPAGLIDEKMVLLAPPVAVAPWRELAAAAPPPPPPITLRDWFIDVV